MNLEKMTSQLKSALMQAQSIALGNNNLTIEPIHLLKALLEAPESATVTLLQRSGVDIALLKKHLKQSLADLPSSQGSDGDISVSRNLQKIFNKADQLAQSRKDAFIASDVFLLASLQSGSNGIQQLLLKSNLDEKRFQTVLEQLRMHSNVTDDNEQNNQEQLSKYTIDLTQEARSGKLDPVIGRDAEIRRTIQVLSRRTKNNPVLIGDPGVGKTAIAEGLAQRIVNGEVPEGLKNKKLLTLDIASMLAGAKYRGEFEERMKAVLKEVKGQQEGVVLFIDELHILVGAGKGDGALDASNMLKPALARGELHCIGATTLDEYRQYIEKDQALERRFQKVIVDEPSSEDTIAILRGLKERYELHHGVDITDPAIIAAVELSQRYISARKLPDKAIDLIDEAASRIRMEMDSKPEALDQMERRLIQLKIEREALKKESDTQSKTRLEVLEKQIAEIGLSYADMEEAWQAEKASLQGTQEIKSELEASRVAYEAAQRSGDLTKMSELQYATIPALEKALAEAEERVEMPTTFNLLKNRVGEDEVATVVAKWTGIPVEKMLSGEREKVLDLENQLEQRVIGQKHAVQLVSQAIIRSRAGLQDPTKPVGSFLFLGPTGVGKTQLCKALAGILFDDESAMVRVDMSEYMEKHAVARLIGAPPGYIGYEQGGYLTERVRRKPYSVILLDEVEKAHQDVFNILLQVLDDGRLTDGQGRTVDFRHTVIVMTSNLGSQQIIALQNEDASVRIASVMDEVRKYFKPEFINRIDDLVIFEQLGSKELEAILQLELKTLFTSLKKHHLEFTLSPSALDHVLQAGFDVQYGARPIKRAIKTYIENPLASYILSGMKEGGHVMLDWVDDKMVVVAKSA